MYESSSQLLALFWFKGLWFVTIDHWQITEKSNRPWIATTLHTVLKFPFDCSCFQTGEASANFGLQRRRTNRESPHHWCEAVSRSVDKFYSKLHETAKDRRWHGRVTRFLCLLDVEAQHPAREGDWSELGVTHGTHRITPVSTTQWHWDDRDALAARRRPGTTS